MNTTADGRRIKHGIWIGLAVVVAAVIVAMFLTRPSSSVEIPDDVGQVVRSSSHVLSQAPNEQAVLVEFVDFECEGCRAAYPVVEDLREEYAETVTIVQRYFPLPGHHNGMNAALAVEAAAQQGEYDAMQERMFTTQGEWGGSTEDEADVFRGFAREIGLDMSVYDDTVADSATTQRIEIDIADGFALGVSGTPAFFLNGQPLPLESMEQFQTAIADAAEV